MCSSVVGGHLGCFWSLTIINVTALNVLHIFGGEYKYTFLLAIPDSGLDVCSV